MAEGTIEHFCPKCQTTRTFTLAREGQLENHYQCSYCKLTVDQNTFLGWVTKAGGVAIAAIGLLIGISHHPHNT